MNIESFKIRSSAALSAVPLLLGMQATWIFVVIHWGRDAGDWGEYLLVALVWFGGAYLIRCLGGLYTKFLGLGPLL